MRHDEDLPWFASADQFGVVIHTNRTSVPSMRSAGAAAYVI